MSASDNPVELVQQWIERCVIDLSLCPFAGAPYRGNKVRIVVCSETSIADFLELLDSEMQQLIDYDVAETTLVVAENLLSDFLDFNDFLAHAEALLTVADRYKKIQIASFHPLYQFAGIDRFDAGNYTNRAPYPIIQWLRTDSVTQAVDSTDTKTIPDRNIQKLKAMKTSQLRSLFPWVPYR